MIGYLGYCKRVEPKTECERTESLGIDETEEPSETEDYIPETPRLFWVDLKTMLSKKLSTTEFTSTIKYV